MGVLTQPRGKTSTRCTPDPTTFTRLDELGLEVVAQRVESGQASLVCRVVAMDRFTRFKTAASEKLPTATTVMDPFHIARLARDALDQLPAPRPTRTPQAPRPGRRSPVPGPPHPPHQHQSADRTTTNPPSTRCSPTITNVEVEATRHIYQQMIAAYRESDPTTGKTRMKSLITKLTHAVPACLTEAAALGRTLKKRAADILTFLRPPPHQQRPHRSDQRPPRTPPRLRTRLPQPHPLHHPSTPRDRRLQTSPTPSIVKSLGLSARGRLLRFLGHQAHARDLLSNHATFPTSYAGVSGQKHHWADSPTAGGTAAGSMIRHRRGP
mgnify:CR=1 FL=1